MGQVEPAARGEKWRPALALPVVLPDLLGANRNGTRRHPRTAEVPCDGGGHAGNGPLVLPATGERPRTGQDDHLGVADEGECGLRAIRAGNAASAGRNGHPGGARIPQGVENVGEPRAGAAPLP